MQEEGTSFGARATAWQRRPRDPGGPVRPGRAPAGTVRASATGVPTAPAPASERPSGGPAA